MQGNVSRIVHLDFSSKGELEEFVKRYSKEAPPLAEEALQLTLIKTTEESLIIVAIYKDDQDAEKVRRKLGPWVQKFSEVYKQSFSLMGEVKFSRRAYED